MSTAPVDILAEIAAHAPEKGGRCGVRRALAQLDDDVATGYAAAIALPAEVAAGSAIERALKARGVALRASAIQRHRRDACRCVADLTPADE